MSCGCKNKCRKKPACWYKPCCTRLREAMSPLPGGYAPSSLREEGLTLEGLATIIAGRFDEALGNPSFEDFEEDITLQYQILAGVYSAHEDLRALEFIALKDALGPVDAVEQSGYTIRTHAELGEMRRRFDELRGGFDE
jgi:hypothetical protein